MGAHKSHNMDLNSMKSFNRLMHSGGKLKRKHMIIKLMLGSEPMTDQQISVALGFDHKSSVQPRISDLVKEGVLVKTGDVISDANIPIRLVAIRGYLQLSIC